ncbi:uncharacterized protein BX664DRAFT_328790, partial [Halteromyces radiatus]|uniref:uncharacterized protein n=1 Tax=Halteromyces radiatus TaxID=101107 RepID=UPI00221FCD64
MWVTSFFSLLSFLYIDFKVLVYQLVIFFIYIFILTTCQCNRFFFLIIFLIIYFFFWMYFSFFIQLQNTL